MRALWTQELVTYEGRWHKVTDAGLNPLPVRRPIPVWFGGMAEQVMRRVGRVGDGWYPQGPPDARKRDMIERVHDYARKAGRDPASLGIQGTVMPNGQPEESVKRAAAWKAVGATHAAVSTMNAGHRSADDHIDAIRRFKESAGDLKD